VTVKTTAAAGSAFLEYKEGTGSAAACNGIKTTECSFTVEADSALKSEVTKVKRAFTVTKAGNGSGTIECKVGAGPFGPCEPSYDDGSEITIRATADPNNSLAPFSGGSGSAATCNGNNGECKFTIKADSGLTVTFNANPTEGGGGSTPAPAPAPAPAPTPTPKPLKCKKGFKKKKVHGKKKCVKIKHRHRHRKGR
jgi:hypothetical protein